MTINHTFCVENLQQYAQVSAAEGLLSCVRHNKILDKAFITTLALNIIFAVATPLTLGMTAIIPSLFCIASGGLGILNVYSLRERLFLKKEAASWEPIFKDILEGNYTSAERSLKRKIDSIVSQAEKGIALSTYAHKFTVLENRYIPHQGEQFFFSLEYQTSILKSLQTRNIISDQLKNELERDGQRCLRIANNVSDAIEEANHFQNTGIRFTGRKIHNYSLLLFLDIRKAVINLVRNTRSEEDHYIERDLSAYQSYFKLIQTNGQGADQINPLWFQNIAECETIRELYHTLNSMEVEHLNFAEELPLENQ
ncbi:MAG: hypothetical protein H0V82_12470 [Candidatus Protochlamydia sp.]|nr:hypothetical protein [Candidatus Protochlamydia sp.]